MTASTPTSEDKRLTTLPIVVLRSGELPPPDAAFAPACSCDWVLANARWGRTTAVAAITITSAIIIFVLDIMVIVIKALS
jgi:hypothetical protein